MRRFQEIGGYIELDTYQLPMFHDGSIALNCGRNALAYLIRAREIKKLWIPRFICDSVTRVCERESVPYALYGIGYDFMPSQEFHLDEDEWLYLVNYYSQINNERLSELSSKYKRVIVDNAQSYFQSPVPGVDSIYTCRKYFGVSDGAFLYTDVFLNERLPLDESFERMRFLLGRYERSASEFYNEYIANNKFFADEPIKQMSKLTYNLLHGIDYLAVARQRKTNFEFLNDKIGKYNQLDLQETGTFMYPFMIENGKDIRKQLIKEKIFIPTLWPSVFGMTEPGDAEFKMAENILPLPIDQRYGLEDMSYIVEKVLHCTKI